MSKWAMSKWAMQTWLRNPTIAWWAGRCDRETWAHACKWVVTCAWPSERVCRLAAARIRSEDMWRDVCALPRQWAIEEQRLLYSVAKMVENVGKMVNTFLPCVHGRRTCGVATGHGQVGMSKIGCPTQFFGSAKA